MRNHRHLVLPLALATSAVTAFVAAGSAAAETTTSRSPVRINSGGPALTDARGQTWLADTFVTGGRPALARTSFGTTTAPPPVVSDTPEVDGSERYGAMAYSVPVVRGTDYQVRLHLTEVWFRTAGARVFDIGVEGRTIAAGKDMLADGTRLTTQILEVPVRAADDALDITFDNVVNNASVTAVEVLPVASPAPSSPSGMDMPVGDQPGYRQVFTDSFSGSALNTSKWGRYGGEPGSDPGSRWAGSHVVVGDGVVSLQTYRDPAYGGAWTSGGLNNAKVGALSSGKYEIRMRADQAKGINAVGLLWPKSNSWPPEIDFVEDRDGDRENFSATLHYRNDGHKMIHASKTLDMTQWHTYGVEWKAGQLTYTVDGSAWRTITSPFVPTVPMGLGIQTNAVTRGAVKPDASTPARSEVEIDWVVGYAPS